MYGTPGYAYIYLNYGIHHLLNVVTEPRGVPAAVLIRALVPLEGIPEMHRRRQRARNSRKRLAEHELCRGPGNLTRALGIDLRQNGLNLCEAQLHVESGMSRFETIGWSERVGIRVGTDRNWRCFAMDQVAVSKPIAGLTISDHPTDPEQFAPRSQLNRHHE
jgi:DNA-3-methyladenine glycosylase